MAAIPTEEFAASLQRLDHGEFAAFTAALWEGAGWDTRTEGAVVVAARGAERRRLLVLRQQSVFASSRFPDTDRSIDALVTPARESSTDEWPPWTADAAVHSVEELRNRLLYGVEPGLAASICEQHLGVTLRGTEWEPSANTLHTRAAVALLVVGLVAVGAVTAVQSFGADPQPEAEGGSVETPGVDSAADDPSPESGQEGSQQQPSGAAGSQGGKERAGAILGPVLYVGVLDNTLYAVNATTGERLWAYEDPTDGIGSSPTVVGGTVYVGTGDGTVDAIDGESGEQTWQATGLSGAVFSSPTVLGVTENRPSVFTGSYNGGIYAFNATSGRQLWSREDLASSITGSPAASRDRVFIGDNSGLYALDALNGTLAWEFTPPEQGVVSSPAHLAREKPAEGLVYASVAGTLYALNQSGAKQWTFEGTSRSVHASSPTVLPASSKTARDLGIDTPRVFATGENGTLHALNAETGVEVWNVTAAVEWTTSPTLDSEHVYAGTKNGTLYALDPATGELAWRFSKPVEGIHTVPTTAGGTLYFGTDNGTLYGVDSATGTSEFSTDLSDRWIRSSPTVVLDPASGHSVDSRVRLGTLGYHLGIRDFQPLARAYLTHLERPDSSRSGDEKPE